MNNEDLVYKVNEIIEYNLSNSQLNGEYIARKVGMSRMHLHRKLKASIAQNSSEYILSFRINHAKVLLSSTQFSITDISRMVGFQDLSYFSKVFKREVQVTPIQYRKNY